MPPQHTVLLVTEEAVTISAVTAALQSNGQLLREAVCRDLNELNIRLSTSPTPAVILDIDAHPQRMLASLDPFVRRFPDTRFIVLSANMDSRLMLEAMQAGARHFLTKQEVATNLCGVLRRLCQPAADAQGKIISVFSASGGCGATTISVNLACEFQAASERPTLLVDLDYAYGGAAAYLGVEGTYGVMDLQDRTGSIDPELISTSAVTYGSNLKVLVSATAARLGMAGTYSRLRDTMQACAQTASLIIVDAPRLPLDVAADLAKISDANLLVLQLSVKDVRTARAMMVAMHARGVAPDAFTLLINRYRKRAATLDLEEARKALNNVQLECLSNDFQAVSESINFGQPLEKTAPRCTFRKELQQLAAKLLPAPLPAKGVLV